MCFHHPIPLKTTSIQGNPIKEGHKTHTCHGPVTAWQRNVLIYIWASHLLFSLKLRFVQGVQQGM
jgi:hypothetical protein